MQKRFRNAQGQLTMGLEQIKRETIFEAMDYYRSGKIYLFKEDGREYVCLPWLPGDGELVHFQSFDGYELSIPLDTLGTFLPDVASEGNELILVE